MKPIPSPRFVEAQKELQNIIEARGQGRRRDELVKELTGEFMDAFRLRNTKASPDWIRKLIWGADYFDHLTFYRRDDRYIIVSQPYGFNPEAARDWCARIGATLLVATEWAHYYPGSDHADCLIFDFPYRKPR